LPISPSSAGALMLYVTSADPFSSLTWIRRMKQLCLHRNHHLLPLVSRTRDGRYRTQVAVVMLNADKSPSQQFVDGKICDTESEAEVHAIDVGRAWVDSKIPTRR
jgi:hypothetical protein